MKDQNNTRFSGLKTNSLGTYAESSTTCEKSAIQGIRAQRYLLQFNARGLLASKGKEQVRQGELGHALNIHKTAKCMHVRHSAHVGVHKSKEHNKAFYSGLVVCGNVWACPVCAAKVQERRRLEIAQLFDATYAGELGANKKVIMITFTFSHTIADNLPDLLSKQREAFKRLRSGNVWTLFKNRVGFEGLVRSLEVTHGKNGWHPHTHEAWVVDSSVDTEELRDWIASRWFKICSKLDLVGDSPSAFIKRSVDIQDNCHASDYLAKQDDSRHWGADRELAKASSKLGKAKGSHPFQLLTDYAEGDKKAGKTYLDFVFAMRGKAQLFWSHGLKAKVQIEELSDEELAEQQTDEADKLALLTSKDWAVVLRNRGVSDILDAAENGGTQAINALIAHWRDSVSETDDVSDGETVPTERQTLAHRLANRPAAQNSLEQGEDRFSSDDQSGYPLVPNGPWWEDLTPRFVPLPLYLEQLRQSKR